MKNLKITFKTLLSVILLTLVTFTACKKEHKDKDHVKDENCSIKGTVVYLAIGCVGNSGSLGIQGEDGTYYDIYLDKTEKFRFLKENDPVCFDFEDAEDTDYEKLRCGNGIMAFPAKSIILTCVSKCKECSPDRCKPAKEVQSFDYIETGVSVMEIKQEGNQLKMKISFSGCDNSMDPELLIKPMNYVGMTPMFSCQIKPDQIQVCQAVFTKDICFDVSSLLKKYASATLTFKQSSETKSIEIKR